MSQRRMNPEILFETGVAPYSKLSGLTASVGIFLGLGDDLNPGGSRPYEERGIFSRLGWLGWLRVGGTGVSEA